MRLLDARSVWVSRVYNEVQQRNCCLDKLMLELELELELELVHQVLQCARQVTARSTLRVSRALKMMMRGTRVVVVVMVVVMIVVVVVMMKTTTMTKFSGWLACLIWVVQGAEHSKQHKDQVTLPFIAVMLIMMTMVMMAMTLVMMLLMLITT